MTPSHLFILLKGNLLQISSGLEVILGYFCFTKFGVLESSRKRFHRVWCAQLFLEIARILFSCVLDRLKFAMLVIFVLDLARSCRACFPFNIFSCGSCVFLFSWTLCRFFVFFWLTSLTANKRRTFWTDFFGF